MSLTAGETIGIQSGISIALGASVTFRILSQPPQNQGDVDIRYRFTDQELDGSGFYYYYDARYYDPSLGRFLQADTVLAGLNRYAYCMNNPVIYVDPTGHRAIDETGDGRNYDCSTNTFYHNNTGGKSENQSAPTRKSINKHKADRKTDKRRADKATRNYKKEQKKENRHEKQNGQTQPVIEKADPIGIPLVAYEELTYDLARREFENRNLTEEISQARHEIQSGMLEEQREADQIKLSRGFSIISGVFYNNGEQSLSESIRGNLDRYATINEIRVNRNSSIEKIRENTLKIEANQVIIDSIQFQLKNSFPMEGY